MSLKSEAYYSRNAIFNDLSNQLFNNTYLSKESYIKRINITDVNVKNVGYSYFQLKIKLNRYTTYNLSNSKTCLYFNDELTTNENPTTIWTKPIKEGSTSCFNFNLQTGNIIELNSIKGETQAVKQTSNYTITGTPKILLTCSAEDFISPLNDIEIVVKSSENQSYLISEYIDQINNGIINATNINPFLNGPSSTTAKSDYNNYTYAYIDPEDRFNLQLKVQKIFDQNMYRLDLNNTFLYDNLKLGNDENGDIIITENDTLGIKGYIENSKLIITSNDKMPKVDSGYVKTKISFNDEYSNTFGVRSTYGNIYLSKKDSIYLDSNINSNWDVDGRTFVVTEDTYFVTSDRFTSNDKLISVKSKNIDISSNGFSIDGDYISIVGNSVTMPTTPYDVSSIYFDNNRYFLNFTNSHDYSSTINGNSWIVKGNSWFIDDNDNWRVIGNTFVNNEQNWNISDRLFVLTKTESNNTDINTIDLSGKVITVEGNNFSITSPNTSTLDLTYNNDNRYFNINGINYTVSDNKYDVSSNFINTDTIYTNSINTITYPIIANLDGINLFSNTIKLPRENGNTLSVSGNNFIIKGNSNYDFDVSCSRLGLFYPNDTTSPSDEYKYIIMGDSFNYLNTSLTINSGNINLSNNIDIYGNLISIECNEKIIINNLGHDFTITGNLLSISNGNENNYFTMESANLSITSKGFILYNTSILNISLTDPPIYDNDHITGVQLTTDNNILLEGKKLSISDIGWNISGDTINYNNFLFSIDNYDGDNNIIINGNLKIKGDDFIMSNNYPIIYYNTLNNIYTLSTNETINTGNIRVIPAPSQSSLLGMQVDISNSKIYSKDNTYISAVNDSNGQDIGNNFVIDISYISLINCPQNNSLIFYANSLEHSSLSINNKITFDYTGSWSLIGTFFKLNTIGLNNNVFSMTTGSTTTQPKNGSNIIELNNSAEKSLYIDYLSRKLYYDNSIYDYYGTINSVAGVNMVLNTDDNPFLINIGSFKIRGKTIVCPPSDVGTNEDIIYLNNSIIKLNGSLISTTKDKILTIDTSNTSLNYNLTGSNVIIEGKDLCINDKIGSIDCSLSRAVTVSSLTNIKASNMTYLFGYKNLLLGQINSSSNNDILRIKKDVKSYLYGLIPLQPPYNFINSTLYIRGNLYDLTNNSLSITGNDLQIDNSLNNSGIFNNFNTTFSTTNYPVNYVKLTSNSFNINNNAADTRLFLSGEAIYAKTNNKWKITGNSINVFPKTENNWKINGNNISVYDNSFQIMDTSFTLLYSNFSIPNNRQLKVSGNTFNIKDNIFTTSSSKINIDTTSTSSSSVSYNKYSSDVYNIYSEKFNPYTNTISFNDNNNGSTTWSPFSSSGFDTSVTLLNYNNNSTFVTGDNLIIRSNGSKNFTITTTSVTLDISADTLKTLNSTDRITYIGKQYSYKDIPINLGTSLAPYDFSINVVYNKNYLSLTKVASNTLDPKLIIPSNAKILTIYPRFTPNNSAFGNENDVSYNIVNGNDPIITSSITDLANTLTNLITSFKDKNGIKILSGSKIQLNKNTIRQKEVTIDCSLNLVISKTLNRKDYAINFSNYKDNNNHILQETWKTNLNLDTSLVDISYSLTNTYNNPNIAINDILNKTIISGNDQLVTITINLDNTNNSLTFVAYENGTIGNDVKITLPIYNENGNGELIKYSRNSLINKINSLLSTTIANGTHFDIEDNANSQSFVIIRTNINLIYNSNDYKVVFYDTISFVKCFVGASSVKNTTWDTTVGWILGFRNNSEYDLSTYLLGPNGISILGDTGVCTNLFNYFLLCIDDFTQNHINDGLITITTKDTSIQLPSYADRSNFVCNPDTGTLTYNNSINNNSKLTQNQIYSLTQVANSHNSTSSNLTNGVNYSSFGKGPFVQDIFGLIPMKTTGLQSGSSYIEFGGTLQNQERIYFGPVNIHRMSVKLVTDRGDVVDLNNVNWSFSLLCEQLYKQNPSSKK